MCYLDSSISSVASALYGILISLLLISVYPTFLSDEKKMQINTSCFLSTAWNQRAFVLKRFGREERPNREICRAHFFSHLDSSVYLEGHTFFQFSRERH